MTSSIVPTRSASSWLAWLQLCRIPNVFTAVADIWMGYFFTHGTPLAWTPFLALSFSSACLYTAGMVLNDVADVVQDRHERPHRPIPSGRIRVDRAQQFGVLLLTLGLFCGWWAGFADRENSLLPWRAGIVATLLTISVVAYDLLLKQTWAGPLGMGLCRMLNVLLGMSIVSSAASDDNLQVGTVFPFTYRAAELAVAAGIGIYIIGVTWFARTEAKTSARPQLTGGLITMLVGFALLGCYPRLSRHSPLFWQSQSITLWWLLGLLGLPIVRRCVSAIARPDAKRVQSAIKLSILSLILLDASVVLVARGPIPAATIALLLLPSLALARIVYST